jgi:tetratricopeptide (TPR) repeat protein
MRRARHWAVAAALIGITFAVYANVRGHSYVNLDDDVYVLNNPWVREGLSWGTVGWAFGSVYEAYWIPLTWLSLALDCRLFGLDAGAHLVENVGVHALDSVLLYALLVTMTGAVGRSAWVAALFAWHPLHVESVAWVSQRKDVLSTLFWMLTTLAYVRYARRPSLGRYAVVVVPFTLGLLAKPMLVTLPVTLLLLDWWPLARRDRGFAVLFLEKLPLFALSVAASAVTVWTQRGAGAVPALGSIPLGERIGTALTNYALYLGKLLWPSNLAVFYPLRPSDDALAAAAALLLALISIHAVRLARSAPYLIVGWLWFVVTLSPVIGLVQVGGQQIADRYSYLPSIGLFVMAAWGSADLVERYAPTWRPVLAAAGGVLAVVAALLTYRQVPYWQDSVTLFTRTVAVTTGNFLAENNLGEALAATGRKDEAAAHYAEAVRLHPGYAPARNNLGITFAEQGRYAEAEQEFRAALARNPGLSMAASNLGTTRARLGDYEDALLHYRHALEIEPTNAIALEGMGDSLALLGRLDEAIVRYRDAIRWSMHPQSARRSLARTLRRAGRDAEAAQEEALLASGAASP